MSIEAKQAHQLDFITSMPLLIVRSKYMNINSNIYIETKNQVQKY